MKRHWIFLLITGLLFTVSLARAQEDPLTETYTSSDYSFKFDYPAGWTVETQPYFVTFSGTTLHGPLAMIAFRPYVVMLLAGRSRDPVEILNKLRETFAFITSDAQSADISGRHGALATADPGNGFVGFAFVMQMSDRRFGMVVALSAGAVLQPHIPLIEAMIRRYDTPGDTALATHEIFTLTNFAGRWEDIIRELKEKKVIGRDGRLVFFKDVLAFSGAGNKLDSPAPDSPAASIVVGGEITFTYASSAGYESCSIMSRLVKDDSGTVQQYLEIGIDNRGEAFYYDVYGATSNDVFTEVVARGVPAGTPLQFVMIAAAGRMSLYLNGRRAIDNGRVAAREGIYALVMRAVSVSTTCTFRNVWAFETGGLVYGLCQISADGLVTRRAGPGPGYAPRGDLRRGQRPLATAFRYDAANPALRWWKLDDESWVREDVVLENGDCDSLPEEVDLTP